MHLTRPSKRLIRIGGSIMILLIFTHLVVSYLYFGGEKQGEIGGSLSIGVIGEPPDEMIHPLQYGRSESTDMILGFLFRSLIQTDSENLAYQADIAQCNLSNPQQIECQIDPTALWSDGSRIRLEDVIETYRALKNQPPNARIAGLLDSLIISGTGDTVRFHSSEKNPLIYELLTYPMARSDMVNLIETNRLTIENYITSGPYTLSSTELDQTYGFHKITLTRDTMNGKKVFIERYLFKFFKDAEQLERNKDTLGLILPYPGIEKLLESTPRFLSVPHRSYEYVGAFFHTDRISTDLRQLFSLTIGSSLSGSVDASERVENIFFGSTPQWIQKPQKSLGSILSTVGYRKQDEILQEIIKTPVTLTGALEYGKSDFFDSPTKARIYFAEGNEDSINLHGNLPAGVQSVWINGQQLQEYIPGNTFFLYKVSREIGNLKEGKNEYILEVVHSNPIKNAKEILTIYSYPTIEAREQAREQLQKEQNASLNTPELIANRQAEIEKKKQEILSLDPRLFYNVKREPYTLKIVTLSEYPEYQILTESLQKSLLHIGVNAKITPLSTKSFSEMIQSGKRDYDILIIGFDAESRRTGLIPFFDSSLPKVNFSRLQDKSLDALWYQYRFTTEKSALDILETQILDKLIRDAPMIPLLSKEKLLLLDRDFRSLQIRKFFPDTRKLSIILKEVYIKEVFIMKIEGKNISQFWKWIWGGGRDEIGD